MATTTIQEPANLLRKIKNYQEMQQGVHKGSNDGSRDMQNASRCFNCGAAGHKAIECSRMSQGPKCFKCRKFGHKADPCKKISKLKICYKCKKTGHFARNCTEVRRAETNNVDARRKLWFSKKFRLGDARFDALIDRGARVNIIKEMILRKFNLETYSLNTTLVRISATKVPFDRVAKFKMKMDKDMYDVEAVVAPDETIHNDLLLAMTSFPELISTLSMGQCI